jgi:hypothetical protein
MGSTALIIDCNHHIEPKSNFNNFNNSLPGLPLAIKPKLFTTPLQKP